VINFEYNYAVGASVLPDIGTLSYNGVTFSPYFYTNLSSAIIQDEAGRTTKDLEITLTVDGYVTIGTNATNINASSTYMFRQLSAQGGILVYKGRGFDISINAQGQATSSAIGINCTDVAWGPIPKTIEFQPLGGGLAAKTQWQVKFRVPAVSATRIAPLLQFNYETNVSYGEDAFSSLSIRGTMEVPKTRQPNQASRILTSTVDDLRPRLETAIVDGIDLSRFRVTKRDINISRDKRTMTFDFQLDEKPYMDLPVGCTIARGTYSFRPAKSGMGLCNWLCTLRATYTVRNDFPRRCAWEAFLALLRIRMNASFLGNVPAMVNGNQNPSLQGAAQVAATAVLPVWVIQGGNGVMQWWRDAQARLNPQTVQGNRRAFLLDFSGEEGIYLDSKSMSFSATWRLLTTFSHILLASGLWKKVPEVDSRGNNLWAVSMRDIMGSTSWLDDRLDPAGDIVVDFGN
jgi:hypothetical protein